jgi:hypothetical protein
VLAAGCEGELLGAGCDAGALVDDSGLAPLDAGVTAVTVGAAAAGAWPEAPPLPVPPFGARFSLGVELPLVTVDAAATLVEATGTSAAKCARGAEVLTDCAGPARAAEVDVD